MNEYKEILRRFCENATKRIHEYGCNFNVEDTLIIISMKKNENPKYTGNVFWMIGSKNASYSINTTCFEQMPAFYAEGKIKCSVFDLSDEIIEKIVKSLLNRGAEIQIKLDRYADERARTEGKYNRLVSEFCKLSDEIDNCSDPNEIKIKRSRMSEIKKCMHEINKNIDSNFTRTFEFIPKVNSLEEAKIWLDLE